MTTMTKLKRVLAGGAIGLGLLVSVSLQAQQATTQQTVTLRVEEINRVSINLPTLQLTISQSGATGDTISASNTDGVLSWASNGDNKKLTVTSDRPSSRFMLSLAAQNVTGSAGTATPEFLLNDNQPHDLVVGVSKSSGRCFLRVTASTTLGAGVGTESYVLTYTITNS
jgi:hypothetical protein